MLIGYARVSTGDQSLTLQIDAQHPLDSNRTTPGSLRVFIGYFTNPCEASVD